MKRFFSLLLACWVLCLSVCADEIIYDPASASDSALVEDSAPVEDSAAVPDSVPDEVIDDAPESLEFKQTKDMTIALMPLNAVQEWTIVSSDPAIIEVTPVENRCVMTGVSAGKATITVTAVEDPTLVWTKEITVNEDPNKDASYDAKVTFKSDFGTNTSQFHAGYVNAGDVVNLIIRPQGLVNAQPITLALTSTDVEIDFDKEHVLTPGVDLVVPMDVKASVTDGPVGVFVKIGETTVGMTMNFYVKDPAIVPTTATIAELPSEMPAGNEVSAQVTLDVGVAEYIVRNAVWSSNQPEHVTVEPWTIDNPLSARVVIGADTLGLTGERKTVLAKKRPKKIKVNENSVIIRANLFKK